MKIRGKFGLVPGSALFVFVGALYSWGQCEMWDEMNESRQPSLVEYTYRTGDPVQTNTKPHFDLAITPGVQVQPGEAITFNLSGSYAQGDDLYPVDRNGPIVTWIHDFGDGTQENAPVAVHVYAEPGIYEYSCKIHDATGWRWGTWQYITVGNPPCGQSTQEIWIPSGSNRMHGWLTLPAGSGPFPAILEYGPYPALPIDACDAYVRNGYARAWVSAPGRDLSTGEFDLFGAQTREGGYDAVEWLASQPWCSGNVGLIGGSGPAVGALLTASSNPPHLRCVVARSSYSDMYRDLVSPGGVVNSNTFVKAWIPLLTATDYSATGAQTDDGLLNGEGQLENLLIEHAIDNAGLVAELQLHPTFDEFWRERAITGYPSPRAAVLYVGNEHDYWPRASVEIQRWIAPAGGRVVNVTGGHVSPDLSGWYPGSGGRVLAGETKNWFDRYLRGVENDVDKSPPVLTMTTYGGDMAAVFNFGCWEQLSGFPAAETRPKQLYLRFAPANLDRPAYRSLSDSPPEILEVPAVLDYYPLQGSTSGLNPNFTKTHVGALQETWEAASLVYETPVLEEDIKINGTATLTFYASLAAVEDMVFVVHVNDVWPDGTSHFINQGMLLASHRALDEPKSLYLAGPNGNVLIRPYHPHTSEAELPVSPGEIYRFDVEIWSIHNTFKAGHKLRLALAAQDFGWRTNFESAVAAVVFNDYFRPSVLNLAELPKENSRNPFPLGQPKLDVTVERVAIAPAVLTMGEPGVITATINNTGEEPVGPVTMAFYDGDPDAGGTPIGRAVSGPLEPRRPVDVSISWTPEFAGARSVVAVADPDNSIEEQCEENNRAVGNGYVSKRIALDDSDPAVEYVGGWHVKHDSNASNGAYHSRVSNGQKERTVRLVFTGHRLSYFYAVSGAGGQADVHIDGQYISTVDYSGPAGLAFGKSVSFDVDEAVHEFLLIHRGGAAFVDGFEVVSGLPEGGADASAATAHTETMASQHMLGGPIHPAVAFPIDLNSGVREVAIEVENGDGPALVQLLSPLGEVVAEGSEFVSGLGVSGVEEAPAGPGVYQAVITDLSGPAQPVSVYVTKNVLNP